jgi:hypothetical protein
MRHVTVWVVPRDIYARSSAEQTDFSGFIFTPSSSAFIEGVLDSTIVSFYFSLYRRPLAPLLRRGSSPFE